MTFRHTCGCAQHEATWWQWMFLTSTLNGNVWSPSVPARFTTGHFVMPSFIARMQNTNLQLLNCAATRWFPFTFCSQWITIGPISCRPLFSVCVCVLWFFRAPFSAAPLTRQFLARCFVRTLSSLYGVGLGAPYVRQCVKGHCYIKNRTALGSSWDTTEVLLWD